MTEILINNDAIIAYDPAQMGGDLSAILVTELQTITQTDLFDEPVTYYRYRVLASYDLKGMEYRMQIAELFNIHAKVKQAFRKDPILCCDCTGNEGLADSLRTVFDRITLCKFTGDMSKEKSHVGKFTVLNKPVWVTKLALLLEVGQIDIDDEITGGKEIKKQLEQFTAKHRPSGSVGYEAAKDGQHDDFVTCLMLTISATKGYYTFEMPYPAIQKAPSSGENHYAGY